MRTCDGYYFPISYSTVPSRFADDANTCQRLCPASEVALYSFRNPGEAMEQAVSVSGQMYTALPNAFRYRKEITAGCSCRKPGQSWADALKNADDSHDAGERRYRRDRPERQGAVASADSRAGKPRHGNVNQQNGNTPAADPGRFNTVRRQARRAHRGPPFVVVALNADPFRSNRLSASTAFVPAINGSPIKNQTPPALALAAPLTSARSGSGGAVPGS